MQGDPRIIDLLNQVLRKELTGINQYFIHSRMCKNWGYAVLTKVHYDESIDEMKHADRLTQRILFLEGLPNFQDLDKLYIGEDVQEILRGDLRREQEAHPLYKDAIAYCEQVQDYVTRALLVEIQKSEEEHIDWIETQLGLIDQVGLQNYLQMQAGDGDTGGS